MRQTLITALALLALLPCGLQAQPSAAKPGEDHSGLFPVIVGDKWGYIDKTGKVAIKPQFGGTDQFSEGLAAVEVGDTWGYIDKTGKIVINPQFDYANQFSDGLAAVYIGDKYGYIDRTGKYVWEPSK
jgi:hypothetical protein